MPLLPTQQAALRDKIARAHLVSLEAEEGTIGRVGLVFVAVHATEYHDETDRLAVWVGEEMFDPASARALGNLIIAAADRCDGLGYPDEVTA